jgi:hypothetical protein
MYTHREMALIMAAQRSHELRAKAEASRQIAEARAARRSDRARTARFRWLVGRTAARRPAVGYLSPRNA